MANFTDIIKESFSQYSGAVIQSRALVDVRDCQKPSARQIFYCMHTDNFIHSRPFQKTLKAIGSAFRLFVHGDSSAEGTIMRAGQPFAMRYPLVEVEGSYGNLMESGNWAAPRYSSARLSEVSECLFSDLKKDTIEDWRDNYDDTEKYPSVLPSKGFYNIVNGTMGIAVSLASSVPQFNLKEVNSALVKLLFNPSIAFDEIYCEPDFATGGTIINGDEVKLSLEKGNGKSCTIRAKIIYDEKNRTLVVTEMPYSVYTNTICQQLEKIVNGEDNPGIKSFNDLTGKEPCIKIYLDKKSDPNSIIQFLYNNTSLQSSYGINLTMLDMGKHPKVFGWKEALQAYLNHELIVYRRGFEFELNKLQYRKSIVEAIIKTIENIENVIAAIKSSTSTQEANEKLQGLLSINAEQAKAILDIKLSRLVKLEISKYQQELVDINNEIERITTILSSEQLLKEEIAADLQKVSDKFGDDRRTIVTNIDIAKTKKEKEKAMVAPKPVIVYAYDNFIKRVEVTETKTNRRGNKGSKSESEIMLSSFVSNTQDYIYAFSNLGKMYAILCNKIPNNINASYNDLFKLSVNEKIISVTSLSCQEKMPEYFIFVTKNGMLKKIKTSDCQSNRTTGIKVIGLAENDIIVSSLLCDEEDVIIATRCGMALRVSTKDINAIGKTARGIKGIKLSENDYVVAAIKVDNNKSMGVFHSNGTGKQVSFDEFKAQKTNGKGVLLKDKSKDFDIVDILAIDNNDKVLLFGDSNITIFAQDIAKSKRLAVGTKLINGNLTSVHIV